MERVSERCVMVNHRENLSDAQWWMMISQYGSSWNELDPEEREEMLFGSLALILKQLWKDDDMMDQETLFDLQQWVALNLKSMAEKSPKKQRKLCKDFPWIFKPNQEDA